MRRKGELSPAGIDHGRPRQVALPARFCERGGYNEIHEYLTLCTRGHVVFHDREWFHVYCFEKSEDGQIIVHDPLEKSARRLCCEAQTGNDVIR
jgi:hypothetical protein